MSVACPKSTSGDALTAARWRHEILVLSDDWPESVVMPSGRRRSARRLLRACMGLCEMSRGDGSLRPAGGSPWSLAQLAREMGMSRNTATDVLDWLESTGRLVKVTGERTADGRLADARQLVLPNAQQMSSALSNGASAQPAISTVTEPMLKNPGGNAQKTGGHGSIIAGPVLNVEIDHGAHISSSSSYSSISSGGDEGKISPTGRDEGLKSDPVALHLERGSLYEPTPEERNRGKVAAQRARQIAEERLSRHAASVAP
jgi:AraC-like DNA-binding protein